MNEEIYQKYLISPISKKPLHIEKKVFITDDKTETNLVTQLQKLIQII